MHTCPNCGYCPCCGRGGLRPRPWPSPAIPYPVIPYPVSPYIGDVPGTPAPRVWC